MLDYERIALLEEVLSDYRSAMAFVKGEMREAHCHDEYVALKRNLHGLRSERASIRQELRLLRQEW